MKLELNVKRFNNEDLIATSVCSHVGQNYLIASGINGNHIKVNGSDVSFYTYSSQDGELELVSTYPLMMFTGAASFSNVNGNGWYYYDTVTQSLFKCADQSDEAHPVESN